MSKVDEILDKFYQKVFEHAMSLGQEFPDQSPKILTDPCNADDKIKARAALQALVEEAIDEIVGEDELLQDGYGKGMPSGTMFVRNSLRKRQRTRKSAVISKMFGDTK